MSDIKSSSLRVHTRTLFHRKSKDELNQARADANQLQDELHMMYEKGESTCDVIQDLFKGLKGSRKKEYQAIFHILKKRFEHKRKTKRPTAKINWDEILDIVCDLLDFDFDF